MFVVCVRMCTWGCESLLTTWVFCKPTCAPAMPVLIAMNRSATPWMFAYIPSCHCTVMLRGVLLRHERGILYRDLKLDNVMIDAEGHVKLADFGLAKEGLAPGGTTHTFCGTPDYIAPEIIQYLPYSIGIDFWSLGVMLYEMLTGEPPFDGESEEELFASILTKRIKCPRWLRADTALFIRGLLQRVPANRLGANEKTGKEEIKSHKYFAKIDWAQVENRKLKPPIVPKKGPAGCNFDPEFTKDKAVITPTEPRDLKKIDQKAFAGFTFVPGTVEEHVVHRGNSSTLL
eukprot:m.559261 g.559261  ORF g.559261 m.559261 type:complete len:288 (-) comp22204_c0_seq6:1988-2851(-)